MSKALLEKSLETFFKEEKLKTMIFKIDGEGSSENTLQIIVQHPESLSFEQIFKMVLISESLHFSKFYFLPDIYEEKLVTVINISR